MWYVYLVKCIDESFYVGITGDLESRLERHNSGRGSKYTRLRKPVELLYVEEFENKSMAIKREKEIKKLSSSNKRSLIKYGCGKRFPSALK